MPACAPPAHQDHGDERRHPSKPTDDPSWTPMSEYDADPGDDDVYVVDTRRRRRPRPQLRRTATSHDDAYVVDRGTARRAPRRATAAGAGPSGTAPRPAVARAVLIALLIGVLVLLWLAFMVWVPFHAWGTVPGSTPRPGGDRPTDARATTTCSSARTAAAGLTAAQKKALTTGSARGRAHRLDHPRARPGRRRQARSSSRSPVTATCRSRATRATRSTPPSPSVAPSCSCATVEHVTGLRLDGYIEIGFGGFASVVDSLGGVDICVPFNMNDPRGRHQPQEGLPDPQRPQRPRLRPRPLLRPARRHRPRRAAAPVPLARS